jgi:hypothetical protein
MGTTLNMAIDWDIWHNLLKTAILAATKKENNISMFGLVLHLYLKK